MTGLIVLISLPSAALALTAIVTLIAGGWR
jgi:hypothetical protein